MYINSKWYFFNYTKYAAVIITVIGMVYNFASYLCY